MKDNKKEIKYEIVSACIILSLIIFHTPVRGEDNDSLKIGGAFRYTYMNNSWNKTHQRKGGHVVFDVLILNAKGQIKGIDFAIETRYYAQSFGGFMLRNGYVGLPLTDQFKLKLGMPRTPFGLLPFTGNSFMFNMPYYLGFEDDADFGALLAYKRNRWDIQLHFAKNSEDVFSDKNRRYAYDISGNNQELNQITGRVAYHFGENKQHEIGFSAQYGQIFNTDTEQKGDKYAVAVHAALHKNRWNVKAESILYGFLPKDTVRVDYITFGAFAADYKVAKQGITSSFSVSYTLPVNHKFLNDIKFYNDFSILNKTIRNVDDSYMNVLGFMAHAGPIYMLVDYVVAKNHAWITSNYENAFFTGGDSRWKRRFNINLGVYF